MVSGEKQTTDAKQRVKAEFLWALRQWKDRMTPEELVEALMDAPAFKALTRPVIAPGDQP